MNRSYSLKRAEISDCIKKGKFFHKKLFSYHILEGADIKSTKIALVASKKIFSGAVLRNKAKRRGKGAILNTLSKLKKAHYVFFLRKEVLKVDFNDLKKAFQDLEL